MINLLLQSLKIRRGHQETLDNIQSVAFITEITKKERDGEKGSEKEIIRATEIERVRERKI